MLVKTLKGSITVYPNGKVVFNNQDSVDVPDAYTPTILDYTNWVGGSLYGPVGGAAAHLQFLGLGSDDATFTPSSSGKVLVICSALYYVDDVAATSLGEIEFRGGTGTPPGFGDDYEGISLPGTSLMATGGLNFSVTYAVSYFGGIHVTLSGIMFGTVGVTQWYDIAVGNFTTENHMYVAIPEMTITEIW